MSTTLGEVLEPGGLELGGTALIQEYILIRISAEVRVPRDGWMQASVSAADSASPIVETSITGEPSEIDVGGESFEMEREGGFVYLRHPVWSLSGFGQTLGEAEADLMREAIELREVLQDIPLAELAPEAVRLRDYLLTIA